METTDYLFEVFDDYGTVGVIGFLVWLITSQIECQRFFKENSWRMETLLLILRRFFIFMVIPIKY